LVVPNEHVVDLMAEGSVAALTGMARALHFTADLLKKRLDADGISAFQSNGAAAGQTIAHLHFHLVPRHTGDARLTSNWSPSPDGAAGLEAMHELLK
jgi:histidine triad (HIT) family protein